MDRDMVYIEKRDVYEYPSCKYNFSPSKRYPEYRYIELSQENNDIYDMVRSCFYGIGLDKEHYGMKEWNPLGEIIKKGDTVLLKPNLVRHENHILQNGIECLITHPSLVRAVADYVLIALDGTGKLIIGDAPVQGCNFELLLEKSGYNSITEFYSYHKIEMPILDFRLVTSETDKSGRLVTKKLNNENTCRAVNIGEESAFYGLNKNKSKRLRVTNYDPSTMIKHHNGDTQEYMVSSLVLNADVIINLPKPKTHRKAGVTISLKNLVGINGNKDWLPHHTVGSVEQEGDEYLNKSIVKHLKSILTDKVNIANINNKKELSKFYRRIIFLLHQLGKPFKKDQFSEGNWYGNDTIWRTICDLNRIILFADKEGNMTSEHQRKMFIIADMIISGEGEGPLLPKPKNVGIIVAGYKSFAFDNVIATLMGFDSAKIPSIKGAIFGNELVIPQELPKIYSNNHEWNNKGLEDIKILEGLGFKPSSGWKGHIEYVESVL
jgi:uncharacterized protein (DUF362 family)